MVMRLLHPMHPHIGWVRAAAETISRSLVESLVKDFEMASESGCKKRSRIQLSASRYERY